MFALGPEFWSALAAGAVGLLVRIISNRRVAAMRQLLEEKDDLIEKYERKVDAVRQQYFDLGEERFRLAQKLTAHGIPIDDQITEEQGHETDKGQ